MININELLEKLKVIIYQEVGNKKLFNQDVTETLSLRYDNFWKQKAKLHTVIISFLAQGNISINWFFFNHLPESLVESTFNHIILRYQTNINATTGGSTYNMYRYQTFNNR